MPNGPALGAATRAPVDDALVKDAAPARGSQASIDAFARQRRVTMQTAQRHGPL